MKKLLLPIVAILLLTFSSCDEECINIKELYASMNYAGVYNITPYTADVSANIHISSTEPQTIKMYLYGGGGTESIQEFEYKTNGKEFQITQHIEGLLPHHAYELRYFLNNDNIPEDMFYFEEFSTNNFHDEGLVNLDLEDLKINDWNFDSMRDLIYAAGPGSDPNGNSIAVINAQTHETSFVNIGQSPIKLSRYGTYLWIACSNGSIVKMNINNLTIEETFQVYLPEDNSVYYIEDLEAIPTQDDKIAVSLRKISGSPRFKALAIYENGEILPNYIDEHHGANTIEFANGNLWGYTNESSSFELYKFEIDDDGIEENDEFENIINDYNLELYEYNDLLFTLKGHVIETSGAPFMKSLVDGNFDQDLTFDRWSEKIIYINNNEDKLLIYDLNTYSLVETIEFEDNYKEFQKVLCTGTNRYVITTEDNEVIFYN